MMNKTRKSPICGLLALTMIFSILNAYAASPATGQNADGSGNIKEKNANDKFFVSVFYDPDLRRTFEPAADGLIIYTERNINKAYGIRSGCLNDKLEILFPAVYKSLQYKNEAFLAYKKKNREGILSLSGDVIIPLEYESIVTSKNYYFFSYYPEIETSDPWNKQLHMGVADLNGNILFTGDYTNLRESINGTFFAEKRDKVYIIDSEGNIVIQLFDEPNLIDYTLRYRFSPEYNRITNNGNVLQYYDSDVGKQKYFKISKDKTMEFFEFYEFANVRDEDDYLVSVYKDGSEKQVWIVEKDGLYGYMDKYGNLLSPIIYEKAADFYSSISKAKLDGKWGFIDLNGDVAIPFIYEDEHLSDYEFKLLQNDYVCIEKNGIYGALDKKGNEIIPFEYDYISRELFFNNNYTEGLIQLKKNGLYGLADKDGSIQTECVMTWIAENPNDKYTFFMKGGEPGQIWHYKYEHTRWNQKLEGTDEYDNDNGGPFSNGMFYETSANKGKVIGKYGILGADGKATAEDLSLSPFYYIYSDDTDLASGYPRSIYYTNFSEGLAAVHDDNFKWGIIDSTGKIMIEPQFDSPDYDYRLKYYGSSANYTGVFPGVSDFINGYAQVYKDGKWNIINKKGEYVLNKWYDDLYSNKDFSVCSFMFNTPGYYYLKDADGSMAIVTGDGEIAMTGENGEAYNARGEVIFRYLPDSIEPVIKNGFMTYLFSFKYEGATGALSINAN